MMVRELFESSELKLPSLCYLRRWLKNSTFVLFCPLLFRGTKEKVRRERYERIRVFRIKILRILIIKNLCFFCFFQCKSCKGKSDGTIYDGREFIFKISLYIVTIKKNFYFKNYYKLLNFFKVK